MSDEYIRKHDAIAVAESYQVERTGFHLNDYEYGMNQVADSIASDLEDMPSADVVQVCRCRKCKYFWTYRCMDSMPIETCELAQIFYNPDIDFCSLAERREE